MVMLYNFIKDYSHVPSKSPFSHHLKKAKCSLVVIFTNSVKKIKRVADKNGDFDGKCESTLKIRFSSILWKHPKQFCLTTDLK